MSSSTGLRRRGRDLSTSPHQSSPNSGNWFYRTRHSTAELLNARPMQPRIEQFSRWVPHAMEPIPGIGKGLVHTRGGLQVAPKWASSRTRSES